jgi:hypothetical protein
MMCERLRRLTAETVEGTALALESINDIEGGDSLSLGVFGVGDSVTDDTLEEGLENTTGLFVDHGADTLDTSTASKTTDGRLGDTLDVVSKNLAVALGSSLSESLPALSTSSHDEVVLKGCCKCF